MMRTHQIMTTIYVIKPPEKWPSFDELQSYGYNQPPELRPQSVALHTPEELLDAMEWMDKAQRRTVIDLGKERWPLTEEGVE